MYGFYSWVLPYGAVNRRYPYIGEKSWKIAAHNQTAIDPDTGQPYFTGLDMVMPGDIFFYSGDVNGTSNGRHIAVVLNVEFQEGSRNTSINNITLIEATFNEETAYVINEQRVNRYEARDDNWFIVRLIK